MKQKMFFMRSIMAMLFLFVGLQGAWAEDYVYFVDFSQQTSWETADATFKFNLKDANNNYITPFMTKIGEHVYAATFNVQASTAQVLRMSSDGNTQWNYSGTTSMETGQNCLRPDASVNNGVSFSAGTYIPESSVNLSASETDIKENQAVTFTSSLTSNAEYNVIKSNTLKVNTGAEGTDWTISENKITFLKAGDYTVSSEIIYNVKGFPELTNTATASQEITVSQNVFIPSGTTLYAEYSGCSWWTGDNATTAFYVKYIDGTTEYLSSTIVDGHSCAYVTLPNEVAELTVYRKVGDSYHNPVTMSVDSRGDNNCITITNDNGNAKGSWSTYTPPTQQQLYFWHNQSGGWSADNPMSTTTESGFEWEIVQSYDQLTSLGDLFTFSTDNSTNSWDNAWRPGTNENKTITFGETVNKGSGNSNVFKLPSLTEGHNYTFYANATNGTFVVYDNGNDNAKYYITGLGTAWDTSVSGRNFTSNGDGTFYFDVVDTYSQKNFRIYDTNPRQSGNNIVRPSGDNVNFNLALGETYTNMTWGSESSGTWVLPRFDGKVRITINPENNTITVTQLEFQKYIVKYGENTVAGVVTDNGVVTFTLPKEAYTDSGISINVGLMTNDGTTYYTATTTAFANHNGTEGLSVSGGAATGSDFTFAASGTDDVPNGDITVVLNTTNNTLALKYTSKAAATELYLVSTKLTGGQCLPSFKLIPTRNRVMGNTSSTPGAINEVYQNINLKDDDLIDYSTRAKIADNEDVDFWIQNIGGTIILRPQQNDFEFTKDQFAQKGTSQAYFEDYKEPIMTGDLKFHFKKGMGKSYTFCAKYENASSKNVEMYYTVGITDPTNGFKLIGNFTDATGSVALDPSNSNFRRDMTKYYYYGGAAYLESKDGLQCDSIVYRAHVEKPVNGWGDLYLMAAASVDVDSYSSDTQTDFWAKAIRPLIQLDKQLDGRAVRGGLITYSSSQSLNPRMAESQDSEIQSYEFSMNITTSTYRMVFNEEKKIVLNDLDNVTYTSNGTTVTRRIVGKGSKYRYFISWSDMIAYNKPEYLDVFVVSNITTTDGVATLTLSKLDGDYIPANTGVLLAAKADYTYSTETNSSEPYVTTKAEGSNGYNTLTVPLSAYINEKQSATSKLIALQEPEIIPKEFTETDKDGKAVKGNNYLFGFYKATAVISDWTTNSSVYTTENDFLFGYWLSAGTRKSNANTAYLHLTEAERGNSRIGTAYNNATWDEISTGAKSLPAAMIDFSMFDDEETDGINNVNDNVNETLRYENYYNIAGQRIAEPVRGQIYIMNGRKYIAK